MAKRGSRTAGPAGREPPSSGCGELADQRDRLFEALGIIEVARHALASRLTKLDEHSVIDALKAAYRIVDDVACALEKNESAPVAEQSASEPSS
jgi:hypothetical protein